MATSIPHGAPLRLVTASFQSPPARAPSAEGIAFANSYLALTPEQQALFCELAAAEGIDLPVAFFRGSRQRLRLITATPAALPLTELAAPELGEREIIIDVRPHLWIQYEGTRAQLEDEGLIAKDADWPARATDIRWKKGGFDYWLRRTRPAGLKGPKRTWLEMDNWFIRVEVADRPSDWRARRGIEEKRDALRAEIHSCSPLGRFERSIQWQTLWAARDDKAFQAFKSTFAPERKRPGRKPKAQAVEGPQQAV